jgi:hypothetical protein
VGTRFVEEIGMDIIVYLQIEDSITHASVDGYDVVVPSIFVVGA